MSKWFDALDPYTKEQIVDAKDGAKHFGNRVSELVLIVQLCNMLDKMEQENIANSETSDGIKSDPT